MIPSMRKDRTFWNNGTIYCSKRHPVDQHLLAYEVESVNLQSASSAAVPMGSTEITGSRAPMDDELDGKDEREGLPGRSASAILRHVLWCQLDKLVSRARG